MEILLSGNLLLSSTIKRVKAPISAQKYPPPFRGGGLGSGIALKA
jgi:hypothetical protein